MMDNNQNGIMTLLDYMDKAFDYCTLKVDRQEYDNDFIGMINAMLDLFVLINERTNSGHDPVLGQAGGKLADKFIEVVENINNREYVNLNVLFCRDTKVVFEQWKQILADRYKYKIIVYGITQHCMLPLRIIDEDRADIVAYIDDSGDNVGKEIQGVRIIDLSQLRRYEYDYLLLLGGIEEDRISSLMNEGVLNAGKIFKFCRHFLIDSDCNFYTKYYHFIDSDKKYEGFITGLSYFESGVNTDFLKKRFFNFAVATQDLFFDYHLVKYALGFENFRKTIQYVIIGMPYFGFGYDLSKSKNVRTIRTEIYYPVLGTVHNYENADTFKKEYDDYRNVCRKIFRPDYGRIIYETLKHSGLKALEKGRRTEFNSSILTDDEKDILIKDVRRDFKNRYSLTIEENIEIMKEYLGLLESCNIKPIILCCPVTKLYRDNASEKIKREFYSIINELKEEFAFQFIDFFESEAFEDGDFSDTSHLNYKGAKRFTQILNDVIEW